MSSYDELLVVYSGLRRLFKVKDVIMNRTIAVTENLYYNLFLSEARNSDGLFVGPHIEKPGFVQFSWVRHFTSRSTLPTQKYG